MDAVHPTRDVTQSSLDRRRRTLSSLPFHPLRKHTHSFGARSFNVAAPTISYDYVSSCGFSLMFVVYQVVGVGRGFDRQLGRLRRSVASSVKDDHVATAETSSN